MTVGIGVDVGGTHIACCGVNLETGELIKESYNSVHVDSKATKNEIFEAWARPINSTYATLINDHEIEGVGFGMPGAFNYRRGIGLFKGNDKYESLYKVNVAKEFLEYLPSPALNIRFINDATAFAVGSSWMGQIGYGKRSISITLGTGFGSSFIEDFAPVVSGDEVPQFGCMWHLPFKEGRADEYFSTRWFVNTYEKITGKRLKGVKEIIELGEEKLVHELFSDFADNLAEFLMPWLKKFAPDLLIVGGNISRAWSRIEPRLLEHFNAKNIGINIEISQLMQDAAISGSARLLVESYWRTVKDDLPEN
ncbi:ROK family protein [Reichenbachiella ulvae]|uniref:ROK family protein n=1 Tax=Reichenbachiella ulvae TaxID=2980104 RepID=A0ABT3CNI8_9BACT|nr:ROK family protein [Reichenbachiella ulvae]MCV9385251.1 ROK family protein [Reichenbachiella ulvae]